MLNNKATNQMKLQRWALTSALIVSHLTGTHLLADDTADTIDSLKKRIEQLDQKVSVLERNRELEKDAADTKAKEAPKISLGEKGFAFGSGDGNFTINLQGLLQFDSRTFFKDGGINGNDGFVLRRARPIISGTVFKDFDFLFVPDFGANTTLNSAPVIQDAYLNYRYRQELQLRFGKYKSPVGLELLQSDSLMTFIERALPSDLVPNRDLGAELLGDLFDGRVSYAAGIFNGVADQASSGNLDFEDGKEFVGRIFLQPFKKSRAAALQGLGFGVGGSYGSRFGTAANSGLAGGYTTDGQQRFFVYTNGIAAGGTQWRISPQGYYYYGPFGLLGEYVVSSQEVLKTTAPTATAELEHKAWQIVGSWVLTGEDNTYKGVVPSHPFNPGAGQWGAVQLAARYARLDVDSDTFPMFANPATSAQSAKSWSVGVNWWLNRNVRISADFARTTFAGGAGTGATVTQQPENVLFTRVQFAF